MIHDHMAHFFIDIHIILILMLDCVGIPTEMGLARTSW